MNALLRWLLAGFATAALAEDPDAEPWQVRAELQVIHLDESAALPLIARFTDDATGATEELRKLLTDGTATLAAHLVGRTGNYLRCAMEQIEEMKFSSSMDPFDPSVVPFRKVSPAPEPIHFPRRSFEFRQIGTSLDIAPFVYPGGRVVRIAFNTVRRDFAGMERSESAIQRDGSKLCFDLPVIFSRENAATAFVRPGTPALLGCFKLRNQKRRFEIHVLTAHIRRIAEPLPKLSGKLDPRNIGQQPGQLPLLPASQARVELHRFILPEKDALGFRASLLDPGKIEASFSSLMAGVKTGRFELAGLQLITSHDESFNGAQNLREQPYPSDESYGHMGGPLMPMPLHAMIDNPPFAFERRDVGEQFEVSAKFNPAEDSVELRFMSNNTRFHGFHRWATGGDEKSQSVNTYSYLPDFTDLKTMATISLANRQRTLIHFHKLPAPDDRVEVSLIRAVIERFAPDNTP